MEIQRAIVVYKSGSEVSHYWADRCASELTALGVQVLMGPSGASQNPYPVFLESMRQGIDLAVVLGGDGSTLGAARYLAPLGVPILAVNTGGHLGFLTQSLSQFEQTELVWQRLLENHYAIEQRMMLQARVVNPQIPKDQGTNFLALNEICIKAASSDRMITTVLELEIDGEVVDQIHGDGLIVATPTGTTSYSVAASGSILHPGLEAIAITPICPLSLSSRSIVLPPRLRVSVWNLVEDDTSLKLWTDGVLATGLLPGQRADIWMAPCQARFVILRPDYSFYQALQEKLLWHGTRLNYQNRYR
ncbi:MAG: NAD(+) kinase [Pseudanabaenaceae cyanobacterium bins.68]|nr:NAD(+) kinase [Pseudanabaenaceae cyanobacterium bins.68]